MIIVFIISAGIGYALGPLLLDWLRQKLWPEQWSPVWLSQPFEVPLSYVIKIKGGDLRHQRR